MTQSQIQMYFWFSKYHNPLITSLEVNKNWILKHNKMENETK